MPQDGVEDAQVIQNAAGLRIPENSHSHLAKRRLKSGGKSIYFYRIRRVMATACRHPRVRIVSRHDDTEYVECLECGEVFDSEEFRDMEIEDTAETEQASDDA